MLTDPAKACAAASATCWGWLCRVPGTEAAPVLRLPALPAVPSASAASAVKVDGSCCVNLFLCMLLLISEPSASPEAPVCDGCRAQMRSSSTSSALFLCLRIAKPLASQHRLCMAGKSAAGLLPLSSAPRQGWLKDCRQVSVASASDGPCEPAYPDIRPSKSGLMNRARDMRSACKAEWPAMCSGEGKVASQPHRAS